MTGHHDNGTRLILGSASERRSAIVASLGVPFDILVADVEEVLYENDARRTVEENALRKYTWCRNATDPERWIIAADTTVVFEGRCVGKPATATEARGMLAAFSGRRQSILTGFALGAPGQPPETGVEASTVTFRYLDRAGIKAYLDLVDPMDKAGAYDINQHGDRIIESGSGSRTNVMGLPRQRVGNWLLDEGFLGVVTESGLDDWGGHACSTP